MISYDGRVVLVVMKHGMVREIFHLGHANLESREMDRIAHLVEGKGFTAHLISITDVSPDFVHLYSQVQKLTLG